MISQEGISITLPRRARSAAAGAEAALSVRMRAGSRQSQENKRDIFGERGSREQQVWGGGGGNEGQL